MKPFESAKIIGTQVEPDFYHEWQVVEGSKRGDLTFTMSRGELCEFARCPARWLAGFSAPESDAKDYGSLIDCLVLDYGRFEEKFATAPSTYVSDKGETKPWNGNATVCKDWKMSQEGKVVIKFEERTAGLVARKTLLDCEPVADLLKCSEKQVFITGVYHDKATGLEITVKGLIDIAPNAQSKRWREGLCDFKTTRSASPDKWAKDVFTYNSHIQASFYLDLFNAATGEDRQSFFHVLQESFPPYHTLTPLPMLSQEYLEIGRMQYLSALKFYCVCMKSNIWPSYQSSRIVFGGFQIIEPLPWMMMVAGTQMPVELPEDAEPEKETSPMPS